MVSPILFTLLRRRCHSLTNWRPVLIDRSILHDESVFGPDALSFNPERYLNSHLPDPEVTFGFGRRICPGRFHSHHSFKHSDNAPFRAAHGS